MAGTGPLSIREIARRVERDVKAVHADVHALLKAWVISKRPDGRMIFPYDAIHVDFVIRGEPGGEPSTRRIAGQLNAFNWRFLAQ